MIRIQELIRCLGDMAISTSTLDEKRRMILHALGVAIDSDRQYWAWGRGHPSNGATAPLALIHEGFTPEQMQTYIAMAMDPQTDVVVRQPMIPHLKPQAIRGRDDLIRRDEWVKSHLYRKYFIPMQMDEFLLVVRYCSHDTWAQLFFGRKPGRNPFSTEEKELVDFVMCDLRLLHPDVVETTPNDKFNTLSRRQREVLLMLVEGTSRKSIATSLKISPHTVDDYVKELYTHFQVHSAGELAAKFLRSSHDSR